MSVFAQITTVNVRITTSEGCKIGLDDDMSLNNVYEKEILSGIHTVVIKYNGEDATIIGVDILNRKYKILCGDQKYLIEAKQVENDSKK